jgi:hypothetical protein
MAIQLPNNYTWSSFEVNMENCNIISNFLSENYIEDKQNKYRLQYSGEFIYWYL